MRGSKIYFKNTTTETSCFATSFFDTSHLSNPSFTIQVAYLTKHFFFFIFFLSLPSCWAGLSAGQRARQAIDSDNLVQQLEGYHYTFFFFFFFSSPTSLCCWHFNSGLVPLYLNGKKACKRERRLGGNCMTQQAAAAIGQGFVASITLTLTANTTCSRSDFGARAVILAAKIANQIGGIGTHDPMLSRHWTIVLLGGIHLQTSLANAVKVCNRISRSFLSFGNSHEMSGFGAFLCQSHPGKNGNNPRKPAEELWETFVPAFPHLFISR